MTDSVDYVHGYNMTVCDMLFYTIVRLVNHNLSLSMYVYMYKALVVTVLLLLWTDSSLYLTVEICL